MKKLKLNWWAKEARLSFVFSCKNSFSKAGFRPIIIMYLNSLNEATKFVTEELLKRNYEIRTGVFVNEHRNALYTTTNSFGFDESFFLKYEKNPFFSVGYEVQLAGNEKKGVTINRAACQNYIEPSQANIIYANPETVYHMDYVTFSKFAVEHIQHVNNEPVMAVPFSKFAVWVK